jgi:hypothetical protein
MKPDDDDYMRAAKKAGERVAKILAKEGAQAQVLFDRIAKRHGMPTAKLLFERCIRLAKDPSIQEEQKKRAAEKVEAKASQRARALTKLPSLDQIAAADRNQICDWYYRWPDRGLEKKEQDVYGVLLQRYVKMGGYPENFNPNRLTPTKKRGAIMRSSRNAELPVIFEREKARLGENFSKPAFYREHTDRFGPTPEDVRKKLDYYLKRKT